MPSEDINAILRSAGLPLNPAMGELRKEDGRFLVPSVAHAAGTPSNGSSTSALATAYSVPPGVASAWTHLESVVVTRYRPYAPDPASTRRRR